MMVLLSEMVRDGVIDGGIYSSQICFCNFQRVLSRSCFLVFFRFSWYIHHYYIYLKLFSFIIVMLAEC